MKLIMFFFIPYSESTVFILSRAFFNSSLLLALGGITPLTYAMRLNRRESIYLLLKLGADPDFNSDPEKGPLYIGIDRRDMEITQLLMHYRAKLDVFTKSDDSYFTLTAKSNFLPFAQILIEKGCDVNHCNDAGNNVLHLSTINGNEEFLELAIKNEVIFCKNKHYLTPLLIAALNCKEKMLRMIHKNYFVLESEWADSCKLFAICSLLGHKDFDINILNEFKGSNWMANPYSTTKLYLKEMLNYQEFSCVETLLNGSSHVGYLITQKFLILERILGIDNCWFQYEILDSCFSNLDIEVSYKLIAFILEKRLHQYGLLNKFSLNVINDFYISIKDLSILKLKQKEIIWKFLDSIVRYSRAPKDDDENARWKMYINIMFFLLKCFMEYKEFLPNYFGNEHIKRFHCSIKTILYTIAHINEASLIMAALRNYASSLDNFFGFIRYFNLNVNARFKNGDNLLHFTIKQHYNSAFIKNLMRHECHIDALNEDGVTPEDLGRRCVIYRNMFPSRIISLKCLSAQTIKRSKIDFKELKHFSSIADFIKLH